VPKLKLQKQLSRKVGTKEYPKWVITIPPKQVESLGWKEGESLDSEVNTQGLIIRKEDEKKVLKRKAAAKKAWKTRKQTEEHK
jgi:bifunctional DNA-binding transcriptional regulator/antitoxin component of YhaV-PrlF toxin-antitoxin module